ncbi:MAG: S1C family serine protease [Anaerolineae bacterium]
MIRIPHRIMVLIGIVLILSLLAGCGWVGTARTLVSPAVTAIAEIVSTPTPTSNPQKVASSTPALSTPIAQSGTLPAGILEEEELLTRMYEQVSPSVVHIRITQQVSGLSGFTEDLYQHGEGSGFVWDTEGHIVTNDHVVEDATTVEVHFLDGTILEADVIGTDPQSDIAVIKVDPTQVTLRPVTLGDSDQVKVGQLAVAIGNPFGQTWTMTRGIVSAVGRVIQSGLSRFSIPEVIQTDAAINPGNSGGPLLNSRGEVIGMNTMIISRSGTSAGIGFAIPSNIIARVVPALISKGSYAYPWLGITGRDLLPQDVKALNLPVRQGALVLEVMAGSPADKAGLRGSERVIRVRGDELATGGDVIIAIDDTPVRGMDQLISYLVRKTQPGQQVTLTIIREGKEKKVAVTLAERPKE